MTEAEYYQLSELVKHIKEQLDLRKRGETSLYDWISQSAMKLAMLYGSKTLHRVLYMPAIRNYLTAAVKTRPVKVVFWQLMQVLFLIWGHVQRNLHRLRLGRSR